MKTLGQIACESFYFRVPSGSYEWNPNAWERAAQAVIAAYEAQKQVCLADTRLKPTAAEPQDPWGNRCGYSGRMWNGRVQS